MLRINDVAPNFQAETTQGAISFHEWLGDSWVILFSHPKDFTPVCTTELSYMAGLNPEFDERNTKIIGLSTGRNFDEVLRLLDSIQLTAKHTVATPFNGRPGEDVIIPPAVSDDAAKQKFPNGWKT